MEGSPDPRTDGELLAATVTDPEAFALFYRRHIRGVLSFFRRRVPGSELAFDLTAETFAAALEATPRYQPRPADDSRAAHSGEAGCRAGREARAARGWLYGIAWNKLPSDQRDAVQARVVDECGHLPGARREAGQAMAHDVAGAERQGDHAPAAAH
jgi:DNA-directed RNA polymerase specialized sigma24 family protein